MSLNDTIKNAIQQHLPAAVAGELKTYIEQSQKYESENVKLKADNSLLEETLSRHKSLDTKRSQLEATENALNIVKLKVATDQCNLDKAILEIKLAEAEKRADAVTNLVNVVFKNPTYKTESYGSVPVYIPGYNGSSGSHSSWGTTNTTRVVEE